MARLRRDRGSIVRIARHFVAYCVICPQAKPWADPGPHRIERPSGRARPRAASLLQLVERSPFAVADGAACVRIGALAACGFGQYWRSAASSPTDTKTVPSVYAGVTLGFGDSAAAASRM